MTPQAITPRFKTLLAAAGCAPNHFAVRRSQLPVTFTQVGPVRPLGGASFMQVSQFRVRSQDTRFRGEVVQHYDGQPVRGSCSEQNKSRTAPAQRFDQSIRVLRAVARHSFYCGPGVEEPGPEPPPQAR